MSPISGGCRCGARSPARSRPARTAENADRGAQPLPERDSARSNTSNWTPHRPERSIRRRRKRWLAISTTTRPSSARPNIARCPLSRLRRKRSANGPTSPTTMPGSCSSSAATDSARRKSVRCRRSCSRTRKKPRRRALASPPGLSFEDLAKERGLNRVRRRPRHDREIRHHRSRDRRRGVFAAVRRGQPAGAGQVRRGPGQDRQDRAGRRTLL